jgi:hypothetical protein
LKPTYLTNFEMATCPDFQEFGLDLIKRRTGEIGMHLHAWHSPPLVPLTVDDYTHHPYLIEYPESVMQEKIGYMTELLEETFGVKMTSHRAGRWSFNALYARMLHAKGYLVDCSITPHVSHKHHLGDPKQAGGTDYSNFPTMPYLIDLEDISKPENSALLEVPVTIVPESNYALTMMHASLRQGSILGRGFKRLFPPLHWLRPNGRNIKAMLRILKQAHAEKRDCVEFMLHSSELMPGGSPRFPRDKDIASLYHDLETLFSTASKVCKGATLTDYYHEFCRHHIPSGADTGVTSGKGHENR